MCDAPTTIATLSLPLTQTSIRCPAAQTRSEKSRLSSSHWAWALMISQSSAETGETATSFATGSEWTMASSTCAAGQRRQRQDRVGLLASERQRTSEPSTQPNDEATPGSTSNTSRCALPGAGRAELRPDQPM